MTRGDPSPGASGATPGTPAVGAPAPAAEIPAELPSWVERGVLVYGPRKAGTTLLQNLLDGSDQLFVYPAELKLKWFVRAPERMRDAGAYRAQSRIPAVSSPHLSQERYAALWSAAMARGAPGTLAGLVRHDAWFVYASCARPPQDVEMWCTKEVGGATAQILEAWAAMFPEGRRLLITRDPRMVTRAVLHDRRRKGRRLSLREIVRETLDPMRVVAAEARLIGAGDTFVVAYEDLVEDTAGVMRAIAGFLGVAYTPDFTAPSVFSSPVVVRTSSRQTTEVFRASVDWHEGLTRRERLVVASARALASLLPRYRTDYPALRRRLQGRRPG